MKHVETIRKLTGAMLETIAESGDLGAPGGHLYLALNGVGVDLSTFQIYMASLVRLGLLTHRNDCYHITQVGRDFIRSQVKADEMALRQNENKVES